MKKLNYNLRLAGSKQDGSDLSQLNHSVQKLVILSLLCVLTGSENRQTTVQDLMKKSLKTS